ncbi:MAG: bifunctional diaminohydroxyphosphoribosylaminopyrimidine deaminase/5-amino-6-(5-phosphoribosylamino)uracil reductase RibD [Pseudomonadota bacterium]
MTPDTDLRWMTTALALGRRGQGRVWPNPAVGCVLVKDGCVVGRGWTQPGGRPHAEVMALAQAGDAARGATAFVTLEPCAHHGQTGPCADALVQSGIARCVVATQDPDPRVAGKGIGILRNAGIPVDLGCAQAAADVAHAGFFTRLALGRPRVTLKLAMSLDGRIATASGESQWITGPVARRAVHRDRSLHDGVMVGAGTARADDPTLTVRGMGITHQPVRIVASRKLDFDGANLAATMDQAPVWLLHGADAGSRPANWTKQGARTFEVPSNGRLLDVSAMMQTLGDQGLTSVYCEGGAALAASLLQADLVDDLVVYSAGLTIGAEGWPGLGALEQAVLSDCPRFDLRATGPVGPDVRHHWTRRRD